MSMPTEDTIRRTGRTATQALGPGAIIAILAAFDVINWNETQTTAVLVVAVPLWAFIQNWIERRIGMDFLIAKGKD